MMYAELKQAFESALTAHVADRYARTGSSNTVPDQVGEAIRYVLDAGGKRVRPLLCMLSVQACKGGLAAALPAAIALEMVHTYSLVHDDLPCMDDDDLRRGRPTAHKIYGDAIALLAGDALLTDAFEVLAQAPYSASTALGLVLELARAAGSKGMVLGQALDLYWTARSGAAHSDLDAIHIHKTGYLLGAAAAMGAIVADAKVETINRFRDFGRHIGLAFQIKDDLLDDDVGTGKSQGKDLSAGKLTYLARMPRDEAKAAAERVTQQALSCLDGPGLLTPELTSFVAELLKRDR